MNCKNCGAMLTDGDKFCRNCGMPMQDDTGMANNQYQNFGQPNYNGMNYGQPPKKGGGGKVALIIILVIVLLGGLCAAGVVFVGKYTTVTTTGNIGKKKDKSKDDNKVTDAEVTKTGQANYKVTHNNYTFEIPGDLVYTDDVTSITIGDADNSWVADVQIDSGDFAILKAKQTDLQTYLQSMGYTVSTPQLKTYSGKEYIVMEASYSGQNVVVGFADVGNANYITVITLSSDNEYDYSILEEKLSPIVATATYTDASAGLGIGTQKKLDLSGIQDIAKGKKTSKEKK